MYICNLDGSVRSGRLRLLVLFSVQFEVPPRRESFITDGALVWFLPRVYAHCVDADA